MEIYLVRHTETTCEKGICYGQSDVALAENFEPAFDAILTQLPSEAIIFSSPLQRCTILAKHIQSNIKTISYQEDFRLMEMNFGNWELKNWNEIPPEQLNPWMEDFVNIPAYNGESFTDLHQRIGEFLSEQLSKKTNKPLVIVTHAGAIRSFLCHHTSLHLKDAFQNKVDFGQVIKIAL
ncbi:alpha-ribazole phosphatase [Flavobacterium sp. Fl-77]|uniref:Alpha-ribazole phosphatase n=1 Tax=Flavobacterium flavipigmentatum TaxID=2893884 RepID=A0AAJ2S6T2_9FLAO|nr:MULTISPECIES: alpha-ribazole phosphatase [unclassified Flavobacterium]MDX6182489.1 alpha-ribazole phosphatase [Flavobacterium sp. Fl-33]MDX6185598.1 alpha-ribazole phosphatase [Flavobacterium sp. Fl-77]UFH38784.1 alpha-ribazole phosphatase [Flavobacterium sp. F-70]